MAAAVRSQFFFLLFLFYLARHICHQSNLFTASHVDSDSSNIVNPFARREEFSGQQLLVYKITTLVTYILLLVTAIYYTFHAPYEHDEHHGKHGKLVVWHHTIWKQNSVHVTPYTQNSIITSIYW